MVSDIARSYPHDEAVVDGDLRLTFAELDAHVDECARAIMAFGVQPGDRVSIWAPNGHRWILAALGALNAGGVLVPLNTRYKGHEAAYILAKSRASTLLTVTDFLDTDYVQLLRGAVGTTPRQLHRALPDLKRIGVMSGTAPTGTTSWEALLDEATEVTDNELLHRRHSIEPGALSDILFTSGTTGKPKGAMVTHAMTLRQFADWTDIIGLQRGDRYLMINPYFHVFGLKAGIIAAIMRGATSIPMPTFDIEATLATIEYERISVLPGPPTIHQAILNHPDRDHYDLRSLRLCATGSADVPVELIRRMRTELSYETIVTGYGLTECTGTATMSRHDDAPETIAHTAGRAIPGVEVKIVDNNNNDVGPGDQGEIVIRGYNVMLGYFDEPEHTATAIDSQGWLHSGDLGTLDERGYVTINGRKKDMFIVGGFNTYPAEIENALLEHPAVDRVAVVGVPDNRLGEVGMAWIVPRANEQIDTAELLAWARDRLANYKVPRHVRVVAQLPTNAAGKVLKYELAERGAKDLSASSTE